MAGCNNQAVENVKSNIASQIAALQNEINDMQQTVSRLKNCKGTEENPHNHSSEIGSLNEQISANQELIRQLTELLIAVTEAEKTMEEADRRLRELVEEYQQGKIKRMTPTSAILSINMECLEEKHKAGMISEEEYNQHFNELSELYISSLQSEIDTLTSNMEGLDACDPEYSGLLSRTTEKRKELISFVEEHNFSYPVSAKEIEAIKITNIINDLTEQYNNSIGNEQKSAIWKTMQERRKQLEEIDSKLSNELLQIVTISKELNAEKVTSQVFDRLIPVAIRSTNETAVNACIDYKLNDFPGSLKQHKTDNFLFSNGYYDVSCYFLSDGMSESEYNKILLYWLKNVDKKDIDHKNYSELGEVECYTPPSEVKLFFENLFDWKQIVDGNREFLYTVNSNKEKFYGNIEESVDGYQDTFMSVDISSIARKMGITDEPLLKAIYTIQERSATIVGGFNQGIAKAACELVSGAITLPSSIISMEQTRLDTYHEILDEQGVSKPNLFEFFFYNDIADWKFLGNTATSSVKGICNEFDEKIINGTTEDRAEVGGEIFFNAICAAFAAEYLSKKKNSNTSVDDFADDIITDGSHLDNGKLKSNVTYKTGEHDYIYKTNEDGLIVNASTDNLQLKNHVGRLDHNPNTYGKKIGDHAGHLFGDRFGGSPDLDNLVSQAKNVNLSEFKVIENQWAKALENGQKVTVDIVINYDSGVRPTSFDVSYTIDDVYYYQKIYN